MMQDKLERIPEYIHYMARNAQGRRDAAAVKTRRPLWLVSERSYDAQDNGFVFFQYMTEKHPEIETYYLIGKNDPDYWKVYAVSGRIIEPGSREHYMAMYYASALISTHTFGFTPDMTAYYHLAHKGLFHPKGVNVFLQHGVLDKKTDWLSADHYHPDLMTVSALPEYEYALNGLKQPEPVLMPAGLCRYDNLVHAGHEKTILVFPTWRKWLSGCSTEEFRKSGFFRSWCRFLSLPVWKGLPDGWRIVVALHPEMAKYIKEFPSGGKIETTGHPDIPELVRESSVLVTDYSSVYLDFVYQDKPVVFYQFDKGRFTKDHYSGLLFDQVQFGPVSTDPQGTAANALMAVRGEKQERTGKFFFYHDDKNCERTYECIRKAVLSR